MGDSFLNMLINMLKQSGLKCMTTKIGDTHVIITDDDDIATQLIDVANHMTDRR